MLRVEDQQPSAPQGATSLATIVAGDGGQKSPAEPAMPSTRYTRGTRRNYARQLWPVLPMGEQTVCKSGKKVQWRDKVGGMTLCVDLVQRDAVEERIELVLYEAAQKHLEVVLGQSASSVASFEMMGNYFGAARHDLNEFGVLDAEEVAAEEKFVAMEAAEKERKLASKELAAGMLRGAFEKATQREALESLLSAKKWLEQAMAYERDSESVMQWTPEWEVLRNASLIVNRVIPGTRMMVIAESVRAERGAHV